MFDRASTFAEDAMKQKGEVAPIWHMITSKGDEMVELTPPGDRDVAMMIMRTLMKLKDVVRYVHFTEAWMIHSHDKPLSDEDFEKINREGVRNHPDRVEVVQIHGEDQECGFVTAHRKIIRPEKGKPYLAPLEMTPRWDCSVGCMAGMLPVRGKMQ
jgi:hypothetical protein